jgi:sortase A
MHNGQIRRKASYLMIGLGLLISLVAVVGAVADAQQASVTSPFDQADAPGGQDLSFVPSLVPPTQVVAQAVASAPTPPPPRSAPLGVAQTPVPTGPVPTAQRGAGQDLATREGPQPTATRAPIWIPDRLVIPAIQLDAPVVLAKINDIEYLGKQYQQWVAPNFFAAGLLTTSAPLGVPGNTVLIGHDNIHGEVFAHLPNLRVGDRIRVYSGDHAFAYAISLIMILPERWQPLKVRIENAQWIAPSPDERLTLVSCWPYASNTHRLIIVAMPVSLDGPENYVVTPRLTPLPLLDWQSTPPPPTTETLASPSAAPSP